MTDQTYPTYTSKLSFDTIVANSGLKNALTKSSSDICQELLDAGLRGMGGAGFPTGLKWKTALEASSDFKYIVCNADEGEPGTFKDRIILDKYADLVLEGLTIGAKAIGAKQGFIYLRWEYTFLKEHLEKQIKKRHAENLLGKNILQVKGFNFDIEVRMGAGAYVCGEETALINSLEGKRGEPRNRPPFPVEAGYEQHPTVVNNVATLAWATSILSKGSAWFKSYGTKSCPGLDVLSISGDCNRPGVYEFPMGVSIKEIIESAQADINTTKAVILGGASGVCVSKAEFHRTIAYDDIFDTGAVVILNDQRDMLDIAENCLEFFVEESCGKCTLCRVGLPKILAGMHKLKHKKCSAKALEEMMSLAKSIELGSVCGLGQASTKVFKSIINNFKTEIKLSN